jgi:hypothetical protein
MAARGYTVGRLNASFNKPLLDPMAELNRVTAEKSADVLGCMAHDENMEWFLGRPLSCHAVRKLDTFNALSYKKSPQG